MRRIGAALKLRALLLTSSLSCLHGAAVVPICAASAPGLMGTAEAESTDYESVFVFRVADDLSRPALRPLRTPGLGRTATLWARS